MATNIELHESQLKAIEELRSGSILVGGVGSGKSRTALAYFCIKECYGRLRINGQGRLKDMAYPKDLFIITTARKRDTKDWEKEAMPFMLTGERDSSWCGVKMTVDSWNNIAKYTEVKDCFFILDEQRLVGSGKWVKAFLKIAKRNRWILLSATPGDTWMDYVPVFLANGFYKNRTEFVRRHVIYSRFSKFPKVDRYIECGRLVRLRKQITVEMPYERHTVQIHMDILCSYDQKLYRESEKARWNPFEDRPMRDISELCSVLRKIANTDQSRFDKVWELYKKHKRIIVFYNFDYELDILRQLGTEAIVSEWNGHKHEPIPDSDSWIYLVQYTAGAEGWNCIETNAIVFYSQNYSYKIMVQSAGRIDRLNTPYVDLYYYHIKSNSSIDRAISKALKNKETFNEKMFLKE